MTFWSILNALDFYMTTVLEISLRLLAALLLGGIIGLERELRSKDAGFRTHFLVALGSALFCVVSQYGFIEGLKDSSRVAAQVVSGIGFLGAGTIIFQKNKVRGLTTAAGLWVTAAIGLACGTGLYIIAAVTTALTLLGLELLILLMPRTGTTIMTISFTAPSRESLKRVMDQFKKNSIELYSYEFKERVITGGKAFDVILSIKAKKDNHIDQLVDYLDECTDVAISNNE